MPSQCYKLSNRTISSVAKWVVFIWPWSYIRTFGQNGRILVVFSTKKSFFTKSYSYFGRLFIPCTIMLSYIFVDLKVFYCHSWKSRLLVAFLVLLVVFFMLGWSYFGHIFTKSRSYFGRLFSNIWSYIYLTTLAVQEANIWCVCYSKAKTLTKPT